MSTLPISGKISVNAYACVVYVYNVTSALYCAINNHFCDIRVSFVVTSRLACRWMCAWPRTGCAWRLTPTYTWREHAKTKAHIFVLYLDFLLHSQTVANGPLQQRLSPLAQISSYPTVWKPKLHIIERNLEWHLLWHLDIVASCGKLFCTNLRNAHLTIFPLSWHLMISTHQQVCSIFPAELL